MEGGDEAFLSPVRLIIWEGEWLYWRELKSRIPDREFPEAPSPNMVLSRRARYQNSRPQKQVSRMHSVHVGICSLAQEPCRGLTTPLPATSSGEPPGVPAGPAPVPEHAASDSAEPSAAPCAAPAAGPGEPSALAGAVQGEGTETDAFSSSLGEHSGT